VATAPAGRVGLLAAVRARGSDARDLRDAAHEACHALDVHLEPPWTRTRIHQAITDIVENEPEHERERLVGFELKARAVEHVICVSHDVPHDLTAWSNTMWMETASSLGIFIPRPETLPRMLEQLTRTPAIRAMVARIRRLR